ncbi:hypothetical protein P1X14_05370 [Sphingomonas sp. AOB5]|uniref:hypothetical protein n=1 Tax=Sphingomonas sp. AOB5 TaxID=3034017 RepID=UPI0023F8C0E8|nr:hypothetical protein [Sphingomonas sp. AOB5]MDF7774669.1 hypothetical protein [Sphingomonas sp. AOB5]
MSRIILGALALAGLTAMGPAQDTSGDADLAKAIEGRTAGAPLECVSASFVGTPQIIDRDTLLYRSGRTLYVNQLDAPCPGLEEGNTIIVELHGSQLCKNDSIRTLDPGMTIPGPYCRLGKFTPYKKAK